MLLRRTLFASLTTLAFMYSASVGANLVTGAHIMRMSTAQKHAIKVYFRAHSFGFPKAFGRYHPGPYWILHHAKAFHLTPVQTHEEMRLKMGMARSTVSDARALQKRYAAYRADAALANPSQKKILADIRAIGVAQTLLAGEMLTYHLKGFALLTSEQKSVYRKLSRKK